MKMMKDIIALSVFFAATITAMLYGAFAFGTGEALFTQWGELPRMMCGLLMFFGWCGSIGVAYELSDRIVSGNER